LTGGIAWHRRLLAVLAAVVLLAYGRPVGAENRITFRGNYYREQSTRILAPIVAATVDVPDERFTIGAAYMLDAITSASIAAGSAELGGDAVFTELRHEVTTNAQSKIRDWTFGAMFRYSTETDYTGRMISAFVSRDLFQRNVTLALAYDAQLDRVYRIIGAFGERAPWCGGAVTVDDCTGASRGLDSNFLHIHHVRATYAHVLHKTVLAQFVAAYAFQQGPLDNPYRRLLIINGLPETHPKRRNRFVTSAQVRWHIPRARLTFEPYYSFYTDDWKLRAHTPELRIHVRAARHLRLRFRYEYYKQTGTFFFREDGVYQGDAGGCTPDHEDGCTTADVRAMPWDAHTPGAQITWELDGIARNRGLHWLEGAWLQATYNHVFQNNRFGNARVGSLEFSLAF
jgi:hypothetical protein